MTRKENLIGASSEQKNVVVVSGKEEKSIVLFVSESEKNSNLVAYCARRKRKSRASWRNSFYRVSSLMSEDHNCEAYYLTLTWPSYGSIDDEWRMTADKFLKIKSGLSSNCLVAGGIISLEAHKNTTLKSKRGKNLKAGRPHAHMLLWLYHDFLNPSDAHICCAFEDAGMHCTLKRLTSYSDTSNVLSYVVKECLDADLQSYVAKTTLWPKSVNLWYNHRDCEKVLSRLESIIGRENLYVTKDLYCSFPTARKTADTTLLLTEILVRVFASQGLGVRESTVYRRRGGTQFTWEPWESLETWVGSQFDMNLPVGYLSKLRQSLMWIQTEGGLSKRAPRLELFPRISLSLNCVEFSDCVYDFVPGETLSKRQMSPTLAVCTNFAMDFDMCKPPIRLLGLLATVLNYGYDGVEHWVKDRNRMRDLGSTLYDECGRLIHRPMVEERMNEGRVEKYLENLNRLIKLLERFGGVFHPQLNRKENKALFLVGVPSSYKTFVAKLLLETVYGLAHIDILPRSMSRFSLSSLRKEDKAPYVLFLDDVRWDELGIYLADFLNLLDGTLMSTEAKYEKSKVGSMEGSVILTGNQTPGQAEVDPDYTAALKTRLHTEIFHNIETGADLNKKGAPSPTSKELKSMRAEGIGFALLANALFLKSKDEYARIRIPASFGERNTYSREHDYYGFLGNEVLGNILKYLETGSAFF